MKQESGVRFGEYNVSIELQLLLAIIGQEHNKEKAAELIAAYPSLDWVVFLKLVRHHRVFPLVFDNIMREKERTYPAYVIQALHQDYMRNTIKMLQLSAELTAICDCFHYEEVRSLILKGPVIAEHLYGNLALRTSKDLDILVAEEDMDQAGRVLRRLGFLLEPSQYDHHDPNWIYHDQVYFHPEKMIEVELHWRLHSDIFQEPDFNTLWERKRVSSIGSGSIYYLGQEDSALYLMVHGARHGWFRLRWLCDVDKLLGQGVEWSKLYNLQEQYGGQAVVGQAIQIANELLGMPVYGEMKIYMENSGSKRLAYAAKRLIASIQDEDDVKPVLDSMLYRKYILSLKSTSQKWRYMRGLFYANKADMAVLPLPKGLRLLYFPIRPLLVIIRKRRERQEAAANRTLRA